MNNVDMPIYIVAAGEDWLGSNTLSEVVPDSIPCFGDRESAMEWARRCAAEQGRPVELYRVVEFVASGNVFEGEAGPQTS